MGDIVLNLCCGSGAHRVTTGGLRARQLICPTQIFMVCENAVDKRKALRKMLGDMICNSYTGKEVEELALEAGFCMRLVEA
uniref:Uncharacterized protein n=1 Tax=Salix viminalis TaxID=40686 RepID=A0A6N2NI65_SALVM